MSKFNFTGRATLSHINTRKEGDENNKELALDLKFTSRVNTEILAFFGVGLAEFMFNEDGEPRYKLMGDVVFSYELKNYVLTLMDGQEHYGVNVKKFKVSAVSGPQVDLTFSVSFKPTSQIVAILAEYLDELIDVSLAPADKELDFDDAGKISTSERLLDAFSELTPGSGDYDPLFSDATALVKTSGRASISAIQRQLKIGYNRAARLIEAMEASGVVGPMKGDGSREVLH